MSEALARLTNLTKRFDSRTVLDNVTAEVAPGDIIGVLGKNGAGKTTLLETLLGFSPPSEGSAQVCGYDSMRMPAAVKARIGFVPQRDELIDLMTGAQQLRVAAALHPGWNQTLVDRLAQDWSVSLRDPIWKLSVGERQKLSILMALGHEPDLLVFDEPVASLDPIGRREFLEQIWDIAAGASKAVIFSSHIISDLERAASRIWLLKDGRLAWQGLLDALKESVVRLHVRSRQPIPARLDIPSVLSKRIDGHHGVVTVSNWLPDDVDTLARRLDAEVEVEPLSLEDIFLELHR